MRYADGTIARLGDLVRVPVPGGTARASIVLLGDTREHLDLDPEFLSWVATSDFCGPDSIVVRWVGENPFAHNDPRFAPVGDLLSCPLDQFVIREP